ncbi:DUF6892 domain-containing protein [Trueperella sp. LYQ141]|uniref:DUF6892 domain-containing protein n=1 Tax=Trueperella sp. LYQ141 TaxID=3391058 RepID=UPI003983957F
MLWSRKKKNDGAQKPGKSSDSQYIATNAHSSGSEEATLHFDNLNFKLAVIEVLMYDLGLLQPSFNIFDFANAHPEEEIDTESTQIIQPALEFFKALTIPASFAPYVETIYMDGGNETYMNIVPQWDGEDDSFDLNAVTLEELKQFPHLTQATIMSSNYQSVKAVFTAAGIEVEQL